MGMGFAEELGGDALKDKVVKPVLRGEKKIAFAVTEPGGGSDVSAIRTRAEKQDDHFVVAGSKTLASQFKIERFSGVAATPAMSRVCVADAIAFARERESFW